MVMEASLSPPSTSGDHPAALRSSKSLNGFSLPLLIWKDFAMAESIDPL